MKSQEITLDQITEDDMWTAATIEMTMEWGTDSQKENAYGRWQWATMIARTCENNRDAGLKYAGILETIDNGAISTAFGN
jgi:hypothetical protein